MVKKPGTYIFYWEVNGQLSIFRVTDPIWHDSEEGYWLSENWSMWSENGWGSPHLYEGTFPEKLIVDIETDEFDIERIE